jgi:hypothetical protein
VFAANTRSAEGLAVNVRKFVVRATISTTWWVSKR